MLYSEVKLCCHGPPYMERRNLAGRICLNFIHMKVLIWNRDSIGSTEINASVVVYFFAFLGAARRLWKGLPLPLILQGIKGNGNALFGASGYLTTRALRNSFQTPTWTIKGLDTFGVVNKV